MRRKAKEEDRKRGRRYVYRYMWAFEERKFQDGEGSKILESRGMEASY